MYGTFIGDIVGSKYEFNNIKTKDFPLLSKGCSFTDDTILTVAVAKAIMLSHEEQFKGGTKNFREFLIMTMQEFGRKYPNPTGAYGVNFAQWLRQDNPKPYGSFGNGSAMRVSPCGLVAVSIEEAVALARASAVVSHNHPEGIRGAEAVAAAVFMAKNQCSKDEIREYIESNYYRLNFTLNSIRKTYRFDGSCQGTVPQAIVAFLESDSFEDAIRNVISIGGDCDTTGAITGAIAWTYYAVQSARGYEAWVYDQFDQKMIDIKKSIVSYLPDEFIDIADRFHELCWRRAGTKNRTGFCTGILSAEEELKFHTNWISPFRAPNPAAQQPTPIESHLTPEIEETALALCRKYIVLMECLFNDKELNQWCRKYSAYREIETHRHLQTVVYDRFMKEAYNSKLLQTVLLWRPYSSYSFDKALAGTKEDLIFGICLEIRGDYGSNGSLLSHAIGEGRIYKLMDALLNFDSRAAHLDENPQQLQQPQKQTEKVSMHERRAYYVFPNETYFVDIRNSTRSGVYCYNTESLQWEYDSQFTAIFAWDRPWGRPCGFLPETMEFAVRLDAFLWYSEILFCENNSLYYAAFDEKGHYIHYYEEGNPKDILLNLPQNCQKLRDDYIVLAYDFMLHHLNTLKDKKYLGSMNFDAFLAQIDTSSMEECIQFLMYYNRAALKYGQEFFFTNWKNGNARKVIRRMRELQSVSGAAEERISLKTVGFRDL